MIKYNGRYQPVFLPIARYYNKRKKALSVQDFDKEIQTHNFVYNAIFDGVFRYFHVITTKKSTMSSKFPLYIGRNEFMIYPNTEIYFTPSLYQKLKTKLTFTNFITLTDSEVSYLQSDLLFFKNNRVFYTLVNKFQYAKWKFKAHDFVLTNNYVTIAAADVDK